MPPTISSIKQSNTHTGCRYGFFMISNVHAVKLERKNMRWKNGMRTFGPALGRRRRPPRVRRLRKMRRDHTRHMAPVCLQSVFATRRHGRKPPILFVAKQGPRRPGCSRPALNKTCRLRHGPRVHTHRRNTCPKTYVAASSVVDAARRRVMVSLQCPSASP